MKTIEAPRLVIAAPSSGSGKSTLSSGLMAALAQEAVVQGFKVGPDYIDPQYHSAASGRPSRNLDSWMLPRKEVTDIFARGAATADVSIIEGVMGLFDGFEALTERGSTAEVAKWLEAPVVLVMDVGKMARSAGALAFGYRGFDPALNVVGVICNNVGSDKHALWVRQAVESIGLPVLGCLFRDPSLKLPERHLGLKTAVERADEVADFLSNAAEAVRQQVDISALWALAGSAPPVPESEISRRNVRPSLVRIAVAFDEAFCFYYTDNFDWLRAMGAEIVFFSPLRDPSLPSDVKGIYLGGGYPELYAERLAANASMINSIREAVRNGHPTYAECGGLMYLSESITDLEKRTFGMVGVVPGRAEMAPRLTMGYREVTARVDTLLLRSGEQTRGHEFHYSEWVERPVEGAAYAVSPRYGEGVRPEGYAQDTLLASYIHLHFGTDPRLAERFVLACS